MAYAHARGVVHRDHKPANIMIGSSGGHGLVARLVDRNTDPHMTPTCFEEGSGVWVGALRRGVHQVPFVPRLALKSHLSLVGALWFAATLAAQNETVKLAVTGSWRISAALGDVDGDGIEDLVIGRNGEFALRRGLSRSPRQFAPGERSLGRMVGATCQSAGEPRLVDFDGDGDLDVLTLGIPKPDGLLVNLSAIWLPNAGDGTFGPARVATDANGAELSCPSQASAVVLADWNGDGRMDLVVATPRLLVYECGPDGFAAEPIDLGVQSRSFLVVDWDRDGRVDVLSAPAGQLLFHRRIDEGLAAPVAVAEVNARPVPVRLTLCDWDGNDLPDVLIGDHEHLPQAATDPVVVAEEAAHLKAAERALVVVRTEIEKLNSTPPPRDDAAAMKRRLEWRAELERWLVGPAALRERLRAERQRARVGEERGVLFVVQR